MLDSQLIASSLTSSAENLFVWPTGSLFRYILSGYSFPTFASSAFLFLTQAARREVGYKLIRLVGYKLPALLSADSTTCEIDPDLVVARATSKSLFSLARGRTTDPDDRDRRAAFFEGVAAQAERSLPILRPGTKMVD